MLKLYKYLFSIEAIRLWLIKKSKYIIVFAIFIRIVTSFFWGTQDVEWWKAWIFSIEQKGLTHIYGKSDAIALNLFREGKNFKEVRKETQNVILFKPHKYIRNEYTVTQPPVYLYHIYIVGKAYKLYDPSLSNNRHYNFFLNFFPILYSILTCILIYYFLKSIGYNYLALASSLFYLLNPLLILNSPIQGFWDPILGFYIFLAMIFLFKNKLVESLIFFAIALLVKPTAIIISPVFIFFVIRENGATKILKSILVASVIVILLISPFLYTNHSISMILGISSIIESSNDISRQSLNFWWPIQYFFNFYSSNSKNITDFLLGNNFTWFKDYPSSNVTYINLKILSLCLFIIATSINLYNASRFILYNRIYIFYFSFIQCYIYFMLRVGVQNNHYYIMIILYSIFCFFSKEIFRDFIFLLLIFFIQDFIFFGFGRDFSVMLPVLNILNLPFITVLLSYLNFIFFIRILIKPAKFLNRPQEDLLFSQS
jgi:Gpi18-like mannosyltransferase